MDSVIVANQPYNLVINRKPIRSLRLRLKSKNTIVISAPRLVPLLFIKKFINDNQNWIVRQSAKTTDSIPLLKLKKLSILDQSYTIQISPSHRDALIIFEDQKTITIHTKHLTQDHLAKLIDHHFRPQALKLIKQNLRQLQKQYDFPLKNITVRNQSSRFGSCSSSGNLNFNWQIIFFPFDKFRHVLCHEIAHITHHNHSIHFWKLLATYDPEWRLNRLWLKQQGSKHFLIKT